MMHTSQSLSFARRTTVTGALWAILVLGSCTLVADRDADQCKTDADCAGLNSGTTSFACSSDHICVQQQEGVELCARCHGSQDNPAPPTSISGATETSSIAVGAHQAHLRDGAVRKAMWCQECHLVPTTVDDPMHQDGSPAEITFGVLSRSDGANATWDREAARCSDVYCHGATLPGGTNQAPVWNADDGTHADCGTCHGIPPLAPHPARYECVACHPDTMNNGGGIDVAGGYHIDGQLQLGTVECNACHGNEDNDAPPQATDGATDKSDIRVGAHQAHVSGGQPGDLAMPIACEACHVMPSTVDDPAHIDQSPAEVTFGGTATIDGATPTWDRGAATCSDTYCHGSTLFPGGTNTSPQWTSSSGSQAACGTCHGLPPAPPHGTQTACWSCHANTIDSNSVINPAFHVNGTVDYN